MPNLLRKKDIIDTFKTQMIIGATVEEAITEIARCSSFNRDEVKHITTQYFGDLEEYSYKKLEGPETNAKN